MAVFLALTGAPGAPGDAVVVLLLLLFGVLGSSCCCSLLIVVAKVAEVAAAFFIARMISRCFWAHMICCQISVCILEAFEQDSDDDTW